MNAGRFTAESRKSAEGRDSGGLKSINVLGGSYQFTEQFKAAKTNAAGSWAMADDRCVIEA